MFAVVKRRLRQWGPWVTSGAGAMLVASMGAWAYDDAPPAQGLSGILAPTTPENLSNESLQSLFESIDDSWKAWSEETTDLIQEFYEGEHPTIADQQKILSRLRVKLDTMRSALADPRYVTVHDEIGELYARLEPRVEIATAVLNVLTEDPVATQQARLGTALQGLKQSVSGLRRDLAGFSNGGLWLDWTKAPELERIAAGSQISPADAEILSAVFNKLAQKETYEASMQEFLRRESFASLQNALQQVLGGLADPADSQKKLREKLTKLMETLDSYDAAPDSILAQQIREQFHSLAGDLADGGAALEPVIRAYYLNYNFRLLISEGLVSRFVNECRRESNWINECMDRAHVTGSQCTIASVSADVQPSSNGARVVINLQGRVHASLGASVPAATVYLSGNHSFSAHKGILFDGYNFATERAYVRASANTQPVDARTKFSGVPLLGPIAKNIALSKADEQMGQANATTIQRIRTEVCRELDNQVGDQFAKANRDLDAKLHQPLRNQGISPDTLRVTSSDDVIQVQARVLGKQELAGSRLAPGVAVPPAGAVIQIHQSALTNGSQRLDLAGKTMTDTELRDLLQARLTELLGREVDLPEPTAAEGSEKNETFVFDETEAIRFLIEDGQVKVVLRTGLKRSNSDVPPQKITVPLRFRVEGDQIVMTRGQVRVEPIPGQAPANVTEQVARSRIMIGKIEAAIPEKSFENKLKIEQQGRTMNLKVRDILAQGGWMTISAE